MELVTAIWAVIERIVTVLVILTLIVYFLAVNVQAVHEWRKEIKNQ